MHGLHCARTSQELFLFVIFLILTEASTYVTALQDVAPCSLLEIDCKTHHPRKQICLFLLGSYTQ
jgi:hypothetical protein